MSTESDADQPEPPARTEPEARPEGEQAAGSPPAVASGAVESAPTDLSDPGKARRLANLLPGGNASVVAARARKAAKAAERAPRPAITSRADILRVLGEIVADEGQSGSYRTAAARLLLLPEGGAALTCPLPCCANRAGNVLGWIERMAEADKIAPRVVSPEIEDWLDSLPDDEDDKGGNGVH